MNAKQRTMRAKRRAEVLSRDPKVAWRARATARHLARLFDEACDVMRRADETQSIDKR